MNTEELGDKIRGKFFSVLSLLRGFKLCEGSNLDISFCVSFSVGQCTQKRLYLQEGQRRQVQYVYFLGLVVHSESTCIRSQHSSKV